MQNSVTFHKSHSCQVWYPQNSDGGISNFQISSQSLIKENCHNSRISNDIDMKLEAVTKPDNRNKTMSKKIDDDVYQQIVTLTFL